MRILASLCLLSALAAAAGARAASPDATDWQASSKSRARLIADGAGGAAVQIELAPGAITYWREPGDAGVPPVFDFTGSQNLAAAQPQFPSPSRIVEADGGEAFGYAQSVVLPIDVKATDPARPVQLALKLDYAVCEKICLPARAQFRLDLPVGAASDLAPLVAAATFQAIYADTPSAIYADTPSVCRHGGLVPRLSTDTRPLPRPSR